MTNLPLFDLSEGIRLRDKGMGNAAYSYGADEWLSQARNVAAILAAKNGETDIDQVLKLCPRPLSVSVNSTGSVFKDKRFVFTGNRKQSSKTNAHAREIKLWRLA